MKYKIYSGVIASQSVIQSMNIRLINKKDIHSFIPGISIASLQVLYSEALPTTARILYRSFTLKRTGNCVGKELAQGPYVTSRAGVEPTTLRLKAIDSTKAPSRTSRRVIGTVTVTVQCIRK